VNQMGIPMAKFANGELQLDREAVLDGYSMQYQYALVNVTDQYIRNAPFTLNKAIVFGNHCYSGYTAGSVSGNMSAAWQSKGAISYYGYALANQSSGPVYNAYAVQWEDTLIKSLVDGDSTGVAHLSNNIGMMSHLINTNNPLPELMARGIVQKALPPQPLFFKHYFEPNYTYKTCGDTLVDSRDQQKYPTVCIGRQVWMAKNLNWAGAGECYDNNSANCAIYGRLYDYREVTGGIWSDANPSGVQGICPNGWHVPSKAEWQELKDSLGGNPGGMIKALTRWAAPNSYATNATGFAALGSGVKNDLGYFEGLDSITNFATSYTENPTDPNNVTYWYPEITYQSGDIIIRGGGGPPIFNQGMSVPCRCVKN
jgi:uncharacterized protein (TIGR02145 family)